jgi:hypothetical protein
VLPPFWTRQKTPKPPSSLGYHAPDRLQAVIDALAANPEAQSMASQALNLSRQLQEHKVAPLQPELQAMLDLIAPPETR